MTVRLADLAGPTLVARLGKPGTDSGFLVLADPKALLTAAEWAAVEARGRWPVRWRRALRQVLVVKLERDGDYSVLVDRSRRQLVVPLGPAPEDPEAVQKDHAKLMAILLRPSRPRRTSRPSSSGGAPSSA